MSINHVRPWRNIYRRKSRQIMVGNVPVGGDAPITVQTMTNTVTTDIKGTIAQVQYGIQIVQEAQKAQQAQQQQQQGKTDSGIIIPGR